MFKLFRVVKLLCSEDLDIVTGVLLEEDVHHVLALLERDFPISLQVIVFHFYTTCLHTSMNLGQFTLSECIPMSGLTRGLPDVS